MKSIIFWTSIGLNKKNILRNLNQIIHVVEDSLLITLLVSMILLASSQIVLRNFLEIGIIWADPLLRVLVLWTGLIGATIASRDNKHIRIDLISRFFNKRVHLASQVFIGLFTSTVCAIIAWHGSRWVYMDFKDQLTGFADLPSWILEAIIPIAFGLIAIRYMIHSICWLGMFIRCDEQGNCPP